MPEETIVVVMEVVVCPHEGEPCSYAHYCEYTERPGDPACGNGPLRHGFLINDSAICDNHGVTLTENEVSDDTCWTEWEDLAEECDSCEFDCPCYMPTLIGAKAYAEERLTREENDGTKIYIIDTEVGPYKVVARGEEEAMVFHRVELSERV